jgi:hypothetical protein
MLNLKDKLSCNNACVSRADKGKTVVIIYVKYYNDKISNFIKDNDFVKLDVDPTSGYLKQAN